MVFLPTDMIAFTNRDEIWNERTCVLNFSRIGMGRYSHSTGFAVTRQCFHILATLRNCCLMLNTLSSAFAV